MFLHEIFWVFSFVKIMIFRRFSHILILKQAAETPFVLATAPTSHMTKPQSSHEVKQLSNIEMPLDDFFDMETLLY